MTTFLLLVCGLTSTIVGGCGVVVQANELIQGPSDKWTVVHLLVGVAMVVSGVYAVVAPW